VRIAFSVHRNVFKFYIFVSLSYYLLSYYLFIFHKIVIYEFSLSPRDHVLQPYTEGDKIVIFYPNIYFIRKYSRQLLSSK
jgi:hypothetical protein